MAIQAEERIAARFHPARPRSAPLISTPTRQRLGGGSRRAGMAAGAERDGVERDRHGGAIRGDSDGARHGRSGSCDQGRSGLAALHQAAYERSEELTSDLQSLMRISYAVFCLKKKKADIITATH